MLIKAYIIPTARNSMNQRCVLIPLISVINFLNPFQWKYEYEISFQHLLNQVSRTVDAIAVNSINII